MTADCNSTSSQLTHPSVDSVLPDTLLSITITRQRPAVIVLTVQSPRRIFLLDSAAERTMASALYTRLIHLYSHESRQALLPQLL